MTEGQFSLDEDKKKYQLDFTTSSAINQINLKFLILYIPIFWIGGLLAIEVWVSLFIYLHPIVILFILPLVMFALYYVFIFGCILITKLFLIIINLIHKPKEGVFRIDKGDKDYEFWRLRLELKKIGIWLLNNNPLPWADIWAFRWFGVKTQDNSSHLVDAWIDPEFIKLGRKVTVGQVAAVMSSMVVGKYLIIKKIIIDDYCVVGGMATVSPGAIVGKETIIGAFSNTNYGQIFEPGWIYLGVPANKLKPNRYAEENRELITIRDVDSEQKYETEIEINIDEDKKKLLKSKEAK